MSSLMGIYRTAQAALIKDGKDPGDNLPRVVGLSATIVVGNSTVQQIEGDIKEIEERFCSKALTFHNYSEVLM